MKLVNELPSAFLEEMMRYVVNSGGHDPLTLNRRVDSQGADDLSTVTPAAILRVDMEEPDKLDIFAVLDNVNLPYTADVPDRLIIGIQAPEYFSVHGCLPVYRSPPASLAPTEDAQHA